MAFFCASKKTKSEATFIYYAAYYAFDLLLGAGSLEQEESFILYTKNA